MTKVNVVIAGDYNGKPIQKNGNNISIIIKSGFLIPKTSIELNKSTVLSYEIIDEKSRKSATSAVGRGAVGGFLLGPVGLLAGLSAKSKGTHTIQINFLDGKKSLICIDDKIKAVLIKVLF